MHRLRNFFLTSGVLHVDILLLLLLYLTLSSTHALHDWLPHHSICQSNHKRSAHETGQDTPMPRLPQQYSMLVDVHLVQDEWSYQMEEHFDDINHRAAVAVTFNGTTTHSLFISDPEEKYDIYPNGSCDVPREKIDLHAFLFVGTDNNKPQPAMAFSHGIFQLSDEDISYVGQAWVRGIHVDHWTTCMEWKAWESQVEIDYYFALPDYLDAWGQGQRPVRVDLNGTSRQFSSDKLPMNHEFQHIYDYTSFRKGPVQDESVFQIPTDVVCQGLADTKAMPDLPDQFQMDMEITSSFLGNSLPVQQSVMYDWDNRMVEIVREFPLPRGIPGEVFRNKDGHIFTKKTRGKDQSDWIGKWRVSWVEDYHTGLQYITVKNNNTCRVRPLTETSMSHGNALIRISNEQHYDGEKQFTYQGQSMFRGLPAESWGMEADGMMQKVFFLNTTKGKNRPADKEGLTPEELKELEIAMNRIRLGPSPKFPVLLGIVVRNRTSIDSRNMPSLVKQLNSENVYHWFEGRFKLFNNWNETDESKIVLQKYISWTRLQELQHDHIGELDVRVYNYQPLHTDQGMFRVSQCFSPDQVTKVTLVVLTSYATNVQHDPTAFSIAMRTGVAKAMGMSALQVSDLTPSASKDDEETIVTFNLLGSPPISELKNTQMNLKDAKQRLKDAVSRGITFSVKYVSGIRSFMVKKNILVLDSSLEESVIIQHVNKLSHANGDGNNSSGPTASMVAGAIIGAMVVTCGLTVLVTVIFIKTRKQPDFPLIPYSSVKEEDNNY